VRNADGSACVWQEGSDLSFSLASVAPLVLSRAGGAAAPGAGGRGAAAVGGVAVRDAWDGTARELDVQLAGAAGPALSAEEQAEQDAYRESVRGGGGGDGWVVAAARMG
jgi:hypothetical protein